MLDNVFDIDLAFTIDDAHHMEFEGYRFITMTCVDNGNNALTLLYHYDKDYKMRTAKLNFERDQVIPSISKIYYAAALIENEIEELFGVNFKGKQIDYKGHFILSDEDIVSPQGNIIVENAD